MGRKKRPYYRIVVVDSRKKRDGAFIDRLGYYHPIETPATLSLDGEKALQWLRNGAIPSDTVLSLLKKEGVWLRYRLERRGLPESQIATMMTEWFAKHSKAVPAAAPKKESKPAPVAETPAPVELAPVEAAPVETAPVAAAPVEEAPAPAAEIPAEPTESTEKTEES